MATKLREKPLSNLRKYLSIDELHQKKNGDVGKVLLTGVYGWMAWTAGSGVPRVSHRLDKIGSCFEMLEMLAGFNGPAKKHIFHESAANVCDATPIYGQCEFPSPPQLLRLRPQAFHTRF